MGMIGVFARLSNEQFSKALSDTQYLETLLDDAQGEDALEVDKSWEALYFILTGAGVADESAEPLGKILFSGQFFDAGHDYTGFGPVHYLTPEQVREMNNELRKIDKEEIRQRYDADVMTEKEIYPGNWDEESYEYVEDYFMQLKDFFQSAADNNKAVVSYIT